VREHPGSYVCQCIPPFADCGSGCIDTQSDPQNCGACGFGCAGNHVCVSGVCVGSGNLRLTLVWSGSGIWTCTLVTPTGGHIYFGHKGPDASTDFGQLDVDDTTKRGPENIFWDVAYVPPSGRTSSGVVPYNFTPDPTPAIPVTFNRHDGEAGATRNQLFTGGYARPNRRRAYGGQKNNPWFRAFFLTF